MAYPSIDTPVIVPSRTFPQVSSDKNLISTSQEPFLIGSPAGVGISTGAIHEPTYTTSNRSVPRSWFVLIFFLSLLIKNSIAVLRISSAVMLSPLRSTVSGSNTTKVAICLCEFLKILCIKRKVKNYSRTSSVPMRSSICLIFSITLCDFFELVATVIVTCAKSPEI